MLGSIVEKYKILLVDDSDSEIKSFENFFRDYNVTTCLDPELAYEKINQEQFNIIFLDIYMKKMNGLKLYKHIKQSEFNKNSHIMAYTGIEDEVVEEVIADMGFDDIIKKPADLNSVEDKIKNLIKNDIERDLLDTKETDFVEDRENFTYKFKGKDLGLTYKEYEILKLLLNKRGDIVTHHEIYEALYGKEERSGNIIKSHIKNLRNKIAKVTSNKEYIKTAPLKGYCLIS